MVLVNVSVMFSLLPLPVAGAMPATEVRVQPKLVPVTPLVAVYVNSLPEHIDAVLGVDK